MKLLYTFIHMLANEYRNIAKLTDEFLHQADSPSLMTYSMEHSPSRETNRFSASQEIPHI
jgi:hypothetical protein